MKNSNLKILVCYYKDVYFDSHNETYFDLQCGRKSTGVILNMQGDDEGENISERNSYWSEITGLYWAWKNLSYADYVGLCSYRRFFSFKEPKNGPVRTISKKQFDVIKGVDVGKALKILESHDVITPEPYTYAYSIRRVCSMNYRDSDFDLLEKIVHELSPEYSKAFHKVFYERNKMIGHNMFVMAWPRFQEFCEWVFSILFEVEKKIDPSAYPINQVRVFGYMHEILLGVFIEHHKLKEYHSELIWMTDESQNFKFNSRIYRYAANAIYFSSRLLLRNTYRHKI
jgi:hypothetical protein